MNKPKKPTTPERRIGTNATLLSSEKSNIPERTRLTEDKHDSSRLTASSSPTTAMLLTYDFMSPHDLYSAVFVRLPVYKMSCSATTQPMYTYSYNVYTYLRSFTENVGLSSDLKINFGIVSL